MVQVPIEASELGVVGAGSLGCCSKHLISKDVNVLVDVLVWQASGMKDDMGVGNSGKIGAHGSAKFRKGCAEQAQRSSHTVSLCSPRGPGARAKGRRSEHAWQGGLESQSPRQPSKSTPGDGVSTDIASLKVLGEKAPEQHQFPP